ncbi:MAG: alpha/beta fold hydrolase [Acidimicrobiales bacterium]
MSDSHEVPGAGIFLGVLKSFAGSDIFGEDYGTGAAYVLALHGWAREHHDFDATLRSPPSEVTAVGIDLPGFGGTPPPAEVWGSPEYAEALAPVLGSMSDRFIVLGHSFGGRVAVHLARRFPARVAGLVLTGVPLFRATNVVRKAPFQFTVVKRLARSGLVSETVLEKYRQRYGSADYRAAQGIVRDILVKVSNEQYGDVVSQVECPVELVWGEDDSQVPLVVAERIRHTLPNGANLVVLPGAGHMTPLTAPGELRAAIERLRE